MPNPQCLIIPIDSRPVCYDQVLDLAAIGNVEALLPPRSLLSYMKEAAPIPQLWEWWQKALNQYKEAPIIMALDMISHGGLIPSRLTQDPLEDLKARVQVFFDELKKTHRPRYGFTSILRLPNYNNAEEEPHYWEGFGTLLHEFSVITHQRGSMPEHILNQVPGPYMQDFLERRQRNFQLNQSHISLLEKGLLDFLIYCQDDTGPVGLPVQEADFFKNELRKRRLHMKGVVQTGADEVALLLLAKSLWAKEVQTLKVYPWFFPDHGRKIMALFDGVPVGNVVQRHLQSVGATPCLAPKDADFILMINAPHTKMGDHCVNESHIDNKSYIPEAVEALKTWLPSKNIVLADVAFANGGDPALMNACLDAGVPLDKLSGYSGWNTPGNAIGTAIAIGAMTTWAQRHNCYNPEAKQRLLFKRLLDDWHYQGEVRMQLRQKSQKDSLISIDELQQVLQPRIDNLKGLLGLPTLQADVSFPCFRLFEIDVKLT